MKGFLSEGLRDLIAVLGLALATIQIVAALLSRSPLPQGARHPDRKFRNTGTVAGVLKQYFGSIPQDDLTCLYSFLASIATVFVLSIVFYYVADETKGLIINILTITYFVEFVCVVIFLEGMNTWIKENRASEVFKWRVILSALWLFVLFLCVYGAGRFDVDANWFATVIAFEMMGLFFSSALMLIFLTYVGIKRAFKDR